MPNIHGLNTDDDKPPRRDGSSGNESDDEDEGRQGFFVGGSERSGQQVLGPNRNPDELQSRLYDAIQRAGAERLTPEQVEQLEKQRKQTSEAGGNNVGFRLGGHGITSEQVGTSSQQQGGNARRQEQVVRMYIWRNGFSIDDGPFRSFGDPQNKAFLDAVMTKRIPPELNVLYPGREVDLRIERKSEDYQPPKAKPFSGQGQRLGSFTPEVKNVEVVDLESKSPLQPPEEPILKKAQEEVKLDEQQPTTRIQVRFPDLPHPVVGRFNHTHTLDQLRTFIVAVQPSLAYRPFSMITIYPRKVIDDEKQTIEEANLLNASVTIKFED